MKEENVQLATDNCQSPFSCHINTVSFYNTLPNNLVHLCLVNVKRFPLDRCLECNSSQCVPVFHLDR